MSTTKKKWRSAILAGAALLAMAGDPAHAGDSTAKPAVVLRPRQTAALAARVERDLAAKGVHVALVGAWAARGARCPRASATPTWHTGCTRRSPPDGREGFGYVAHNLYQDAADPGPQRAGPGPPGRLLRRRPGPRRRA
jgi:hypothetical protein